MTRYPSNICRWPSSIITGTDTTTCRRACRNGSSASRSGCNTAAARSSCSRTSSNGLRWTRAGEPDLKAERTRPDDVTEPTTLPLAIAERTRPMWAWLTSSALSEMAAATLPRPSPGSYGFRLVEIGYPRSEVLVERCSGRFRNGDRRAPQASQRSEADHQCPDDQVQRGNTAQRDDARAEDRPESPTESLGRASRAVRRAFTPNRRHHQQLAWTMPIGPRAEEGHAQRGGDRGEGDRQAGRLLGRQPDRPLHV